MTLARRILPASAGLLVGGLVLAGCAAETAATDAPEQTVTVSTNLGEVEVPVAPERVVALDNTSFETLRDWGVTPVALPKGLLPDEGFEDWLADEDILDIGMHHDPNLELVSEAEPARVAGHGARYAGIY